MASAHHDDDHGVPAETTYQGVQRTGLEYGHEERDVTFRPVYGWIGVLVVLIPSAYLIVALYLGLWNAGDIKVERLPSPMFARRQMPAQPRVLPNPQDSPPGTIHKTPLEDGEAFRKREAEAAAKIGLWDPATGEARLPDSAVSATLADAAGAKTTAAAEGVTQMMPTGASGGTVTRDYLAGEKGGEKSTEGAGGAE